MKPLPRIPSIKSAFGIHAHYEQGPVLGFADFATRVPQKPRKEGAVVIILRWWLSQDFNLSLIELDLKPILWKL